MRIRASSALPLVLVIFLAVLTLWLQYIVQAPDPSDPPRRQDPDFMVDNFTMKRLNASGRPEYTLTAARMLHYPANNRSQVERPRLVRYGEDGSVMTATADRADIVRNGEEGYFYGNVLVVRSATAERPELRARTDFLHLLNEQNVARTDRRVTITQGASTLTGTGMELDRDAQQFKLLSQVRGTYEPARR